jgi:hypothetical protein
MDGDAEPVVVADWPADIAHFCEVTMYSPGKRVVKPDLVRFEVHNCAPYPTDLPNAVQHNAMWDALAVKRCIESL